MSAKKGRQVKAVFLDRDGVLNRAPVRDGKPRAPYQAKDFRLLPGASAAVAALKRAGYAVVVVTNQPEVGHGLIAPEELNEMHLRLMARVPVDAILVCPHRQNDGCACRKPKPGMLRRAIRRFAIDPKRSYMVGDRSGDMGAGRAVGARTIFIDRGYPAEAGENHASRARSLPEAVAMILGHRVLAVTPPR
jgi:D-glycero-D-manno-heptose 1,7-bisphosphate phosphatase